MESIIPIVWHIHLSARIAAKTKLKLDMPTEYLPNVDVGAGAGASNRMDVNPPANVDTPIDADVNGSGHGAFDRPLGGGLGVGLGGGGSGGGIGLGGGVRLGH